MSNYDEQKCLEYVKENKEERIKLRKAKENELRKFTKLIIDRMYENNFSYYSLGKIIQIDKTSIKKSLTNERKRRFDLRYAFLYVVMFSQDYEEALMLMNWSGNSLDFDDENADNLKAILKCVCTSEVVTSERISEAQKYLTLLKIYDLFFPPNY